MHFRHDHMVGRRRTGESRRSAATVHRRLLTAGLGSVVTLILLPLLGVAPAQAAAGQITEFAVPGGAETMTLGSDGNVYFGTAGAIGRITPSGQVTEFADPKSSSANVFITAAGPDGNVWFADNQSELGRITPAGQITEFAIPLSTGLRVLLRGLAAGPDGNLWFTAQDCTNRGCPASFVGRVNPATGAITQFAAAGAGPITAGSDGNMWFSEGGAIARVTTS